MDAGAPTRPLAGGGDHSETAETRPDSQTRTLTDIAPGFEIYGYEGERLRGVVPTLLGLGSFEGSPSLYSERARRSDWDAPFTSPFQGL